jgi:hypothetical protein
MLNTHRSRRGMVSSPHHLDSEEARLLVLRQGGNAIEATLARGGVTSRRLSTHELDRRRRLQADLERWQAADCGRWLRRVRARGDG